MKVPYFVPWITRKDKSAIYNSLNQRWLTNGPYLQKFEKSVGSFVNTKYAIGVGSATQALHIALRTLGITNGDEVIVPTFTFAATANSVIYCGAKPIFVDVDPDTFTIKPDEIKKNITKKTKAIIPVHYGGQSCDMNEISYICKTHNLFLVEDCAHSLGSTYNEKMCGSIGNIGCFSFYATKVMTTGEGGMISTNNKKINEKARLLRSQGMSIQAREREKDAQWKYDIVDLGYNYRLDEIRSSLGLSQFERINHSNKMRMKIAEKYDKLIKNIKGITTPIKKSDRNHIYHLYTIKIEKDYPLSRDELFLKLSKNGIGTSVQYYPLHLMSFYRKNFKINSSKFQNSNKLKDQVICLPIFPKMTNKQIEYVVKSLL